ncbi:MAG: hypothetical protein Q8M65_00690 [Rhodoglobus sp.]|nr:hypothetical protein [Rhodoglobus sp.]
MTVVRIALRRRLNTAVALRALTIALTSLVLLLGALAAHHAEASTFEADYTASGQLQDEHTPTLTGDQVSTTVASESVLVTLVAGCVVLAICCVIALALLTRAHWAALLARYRGAATPSQVRNLLFTTFPSALAAPSLFSLSISRT